MATRSIQDPRDRMTTILVAPLMTCSARLPVYTLLIAAFIPARTVAGVFNLQGIVLFTLYVAGIVSALAVAWVIKRLHRDKSEHALLMELPSYRMPHPRDIAIGLYERAMIFLKRVGGIILALTVLLWFLSSFPAPPPGATEPAINYSLAGRLGHVLQYVFTPLGFNWQICDRADSGPRRARSRGVVAGDRVCAVRQREPVCRRSSPRNGRSRPRCRCWSGTSTRRCASRRWRRSAARRIRGGRSGSRRAICSGLRTSRRC